jgi:hypothetical protein
MCTCGWYRRRALVPAPSSINTVQATLDRRGCRRLFLTKGWVPTQSEERDVKNCEKGKGSVHSIPHGPRSAASINRALLPKTLPRGAYRLHRHAHGAQYQYRCVQYSNQRHPTGLQHLHHRLIRGTLRRRVRRGLVTLRVSPYNQGYRQIRGHENTRATWQTRGGDQYVIPSQWRVSSHG